MTDRLLDELMIELIGEDSLKLIKLIKSRFNRDILSNTVSGWLYSNNIPYNQEETQFKPKPKPSKPLQAQEAQKAKL